MQISTTRPVFSDFPFLITMVKLKHLQAISVRTKSFVSKEIDVSGKGKRRKKYFAIVFPCDFFFENIELYSKED